MCAPEVEIAVRKSALKLTQLIKPRARRTNSVDWHSIASHEQGTLKVIKTREAARPLLLSKKEFLPLKQLFREYDTSQSGFIDKDEFIQAISSRHPELIPHVGGMFHAADKSGNMQLSFTEFIRSQHKGLSASSAKATIAKYGGPWAEEQAEAEAAEAAELAARCKIQDRELTEQEVKEIHQVFNRWDVNNAGKISFKELCQKVPGIDCYTLGGWQHKYDANGDGLLDKHEFATLLTTFYGDASFGKESERMQKHVKMLNEAEGSAFIRDSYNEVYVDPQCR